MKKQFKFEMLTKLSDGTDIVFDGEFVVGTGVFTLDENGAKVKALDNTYELEGGQMFTVVDGLISEVAEEVKTEDTPSTEDVAVVEDDMKMAEMKAAFDALNAKVAEFEEKVKYFDEKLQTALETLTLKTEQASVQEFSKVEKENKSDVYVTLQRFFK